MPEWAELQIKTSQRDHLINSYQRLKKKKKKDSARAITPVAEAIHVPAYFAPPGSMEPKKLWHLHAQHSLVQSCCRQKMSCIYACRVASVMSYPLGLCGLWPARHLCQWDSPGENTGLATTGCHTLLEHYISCCSSCQLL